MARPKKCPKGTYVMHVPLTKYYHTEVCAANKDDARKIAKRCLSKVKKPGIRVHPQGDIQKTGSSSYHNHEGNYLINCHNEKLTEEELANGQRTMSQKLPKGYEFDDDGEVVPSGFEDSFSLFLPNSDSSIKSQVKQWEKVKMANKEIERGAKKCAMKIAHRINNEDDAIDLDVIYDSLSGKTYKSAPGYASCAKIMPKILKKWSNLGAQDSEAEEIIAAYIYELVQDKI
jgi:hypothetical protein